MLDIFANMGFVTAIVVVQCLVAVTTTQSLYSGIITFNRTGTEFQKLIIDNSSNSLYIGARNHIFKLSSSLSMLDETSTGPVMDSNQCSPNDKGCPDLSLTDNSAKTLLLEPSSDNILFCGSVQQGMCFLYDGDDLGSKQSIYEKHRDSNENLLGGSASVVAFYSVLQLPSARYNVLHVAQEYDDRPLNLSPLAVSSLRITEDSQGLRMGYVYYNDAHDVYSGKDIHSSVKSDYRVKYIYGFEYKGFIFYLTVQRQYINNGNFTTKLVRVCQDSSGDSDPGYYSYTEIELACRKKNGITTFFNIAEAAFLGPIGSEFAKNFGIQSDEQILYITFGQSKGSNTLIIDESRGSGVCVFPMATIMREFQIAQRDCYTGMGDLLPWIHPGNIGCHAYHQEIPEIERNLYYCGNDMKNDAIGRRGYNLQTDTNVTLSGHYATSILVQVQKGNGNKEKTVAILGTAKGTLLKVLVDGTNAPPYVDIPIAPENVVDPRIAKEMIFDSSGDFVYAMTRDRVAKVPVRTCGVYRDCASCVSTRDALDCGWCGDVLGHCSVKDQCSSASWKNDACPPSFFDFEPRSGPVQGGTSVTLKGAYFGNATAATTKIVLVAFEPCKIQFYNSTMIICTTKASKELAEKTNSVSLEVVDTSKTTASFEIRGKADLGQTSFAYKKPELGEVTPLLGPKSGGSRLTITGRNLDIGAKLNISVADLPCKLLEIKPSQILCNTSAVPTSKKRAVREGRVQVEIDDAVLTRDDLVFTYEEDPYVIDVSPRRSIASGGISITVSGGNLHVVHLPQIVIQDLASGVNYWDDCKATPEEMICTSPKILHDGSGNKPTAKKPLDFTLNFAMDGVPDLIDFPSQHPELSDFQYHVDPEIYDLDDDDTVMKYYIDSDYLELRGSNLNLGAGRDDYQVTVEGEPCKVTSVRSNRLHCTLDTPNVVSENEYRREVLVTVGSLSFNPGYLIFAERNVNILMAAILAPVLVILCVFFVIILLAWMKKSHKGPFKRSRGELSVRYNRNADNTDGRDRLQANAYTSSTQMLRQRHVGEREHEPLIDSDCRNFLIESHLLIDREDVLLLDIIGQGNFGCVYKGLLKVPDEKQETEVAVKTLKTLTEAAYTSSADARSFLEEALRMREFDHPNILRLIGIALDKEEQPLVILPFMKHGDLLTYIRDETNSPTIKDLMDFAIQIAEGMAYLSKLKFVHRDLAARNCMLNDAMEVQVADFGLSRDIYERDYYSSDGRKAKLPVKWMALESLEKGIYNIKTDVWSYGVVVWELMTRGVTPYPEVDNWEIIKFLKPGRRMPQPAYCPDSLYHIMLQCWDPEAIERPTFPELVTAIQRIMYEMENRQEQHQQTQSQHQMYANVPTTQTYLYPSTLPHYGRVGAGDTGEGLAGAIGGSCDLMADAFGNGQVQLVGIRDHNENEHFTSMLV